MYVGSLERGNVELWGLGLLTPSVFVTNHIVYQAPTPSTP